ncbi:MAG TPA: hypothetical protein VI790_01275 [Candidatus Nanoarchaeia archaeon]|nr:hypothetical protein [Candidatus Nanoarchaeia archaeon]
MGLELNPVPYVYTPPMSIFGGVVITDHGLLFNDLGRLVKEVTDSLYQVYRVMSYISSFKNDIYQGIKSIITPNEGVLDEKSYDYHSWNERKVNLIMNHLKKNDKLQAIIVDDKERKFYFAQLLGADFNPNLTKNLLVAIQQTALLLSGENASIVEGVIDDKTTVTLTRMPLYNYFI